MAIINITPDSFYDKSRCDKDIDIQLNIENAINEGCDILDIGGCSTRHGASYPDLEEEWDRIDKGLKIARNISPRIPISIDTFRAEIARRSISTYGDVIVNDVSCGYGDSLMWETVAKLQVPYILTHNRHSATQQPECNNTILEVIQELANKISELQSLGVSDIIVDPGFGFGKTIDQNYTLMSHLEEFHVLDKPLLVGISRKSMIYNLLKTDAQTSLNGTCVLNTVAILSGASILRVHDVKAARESISITNKLINS